jgi:Flp pilus assembly protein TadD
LAGRLEQALSHIDLALRLNPHDPSMWTFLTGRAIALILLHRYGEAADWARRAVRNPSANFYAPATLASALGHLSQFEEARLALEKVYRLRPDFSKGLIRRLWRFRNDTDRDCFLDGLTKAGVTE